MLRVAANSYEVSMKSTKKTEPLTSQPLAIQWMQRHGAELTDVEGFAISKENRNLNSDKYFTVVNRSQDALSEAHEIEALTNDVHEMHGEAMSHHAASRRADAAQKLEEKGYVLNA